MNERESPLAKRIKELFQELLAQLPEQCASIHTKSEARSVLIEFVPSRPTAAPISVIVPREGDQGVTLIAGRGSFFEIPQSGRRYTDLPLIEELRTICSAVIAGRLEEWVVLHGTDVIQGRGIIELPEETTVRWRQLTLNPLRKKTKRHYRYEHWAVAA